MTTIRDKNLRALTQSIVQQHQEDPANKAGARMLDQIVGAIADRQGKSGKSITDELKKGDLLPEEKLALAKKGMTDGEAADIKAILGDAKMTGAMDALTLNFLKALVGLEPLRAIDALDESVRVGPVGDVSRSPEAQAVAKFKEVFKSGKLNAYYEAAIGVGTAVPQKEAMDLFNALPKINAQTSADDFVRLGLWTTKPRGIEAMEKSARFLPGRQVIAPAKVNTDISAGTRFLAWDDSGVSTKTYRATLAGEKGDNYLVKVDGKNDPIEVPKSTIHEMNQPHAFVGDKISLAKDVDYTSPFMKAKIVEAAIRMDDLVAKLDFTKARTADTSSGRFGAIFGGSQSQATSEVQRQAVRVVHDVIDMLYPKGDVYSQPGRDSGQDAGRLAVKGIGSCYMQASVMAGLLAPFADKLGVDITFISGGVYRDVNASDTQEAQHRRFQSEAHGWLHLTYRPSMELRICDRTWSQPDHAADRAYSRWGDRFPSTLYRSWGGGGISQQAIKPTDVVMDGSVSVATFDRQFGVKGQDGRENHQSNRQ